MSEFQLNAEGAETKSQAYREGEAAAKHHCGRGHYIPEQNPHRAGMLPHADWEEGYEKGWSDAFYAKRRH